MRSKYQQKLDRYISEHFSSLLTSNAKWRTFFDILSFPELGALCGVFKTVGDDYIRHFYWSSRDRDLIGETGLDDPGFGGGPIWYREIEWLEIPADFVFPTPPPHGLEPRVAHQNIQLVERTLTEEGQFPIEMTETSLRLHAYR